MHDVADDDVGLDNQIKEQEGDNSKWEGKEVIDDSSA